MNEEECGKILAFKNYEPGIPSCRLYVKNDAKKTSENDIGQVFRTFVNAEYTERKLRMRSIELCKPHFCSILVARDMSV